MEPTAIYPVVYPIADFLLKCVTEEIIHEATESQLRRFGVFDATCNKCHTCQQGLMIPEGEHFGLTCSNKECGYSTEITIENLSENCISKKTGTPPPIIIVSQNTVIYYSSLDGYGPTPVIAEKKESVKSFQGFSRNRRNRRLVASILSSAFALMILAFYAYWIAPKPETSFASGVTAEVLNLRDGPGTEFAILSTIPLSTSVKLLAKEPSEQWLMVEIPDGEEGWVYAEYINTTIDFSQVPISTNIPPPPPTDTVTILPTIIPTSSDFEAIATTEIPVPTSTPISGIIQVVAPQNNSSINSRYLVIEWTWSHATENCSPLPEGYGFEIRIGNQGIMNALEEQTAIKCNPRTGIYSYRVGDIYTAITNKPKPYTWNVALVRINPYSLIVESGQFIVQID